MDPINTPGANNQMPPVTEEKSSFGATIAVLIVLALLVAGGLYFWSQKAEAPAINTESTQNEDAPNATTSPTVSSADDTRTLESELAATAVNSKTSNEINREF